MKIKIFLLIILFTTNFYGQDVIYLGEFGKEIVAKSKAKYYKTIEKDPLNENTSIVSIYHLNGIIKSKGIFLKYYSKKKKRLGYKSYYPSGKIHIDVLKGKKDSHRLSYWENGKLKRKDLYKKGKIYKGYCWNEEGTPVSYYDFEIRPTFPNGRKALVEYITKKLDRNNIPKSLIGTKIIISFYINEDGSISEVKLKKGIDASINNKAIKLVKEMPNWTPAMQDGNPVRVKRNLPITL